MQDSKASPGSISFQQFSELLRLRIPENLEMSKALSHHVLAHKFVKKLRASVAVRKAQSTKPDEAADAAAVDIQVEQEQSQDV
jgi:hypothetical protein